MSMFDAFSLVSGSETYTARMSNYACFAVVALLFLLALFMKGAVKPTVAILVACVGGVIGWGLSVLWVPYGIVDRQIYSQIATTIGAFLSGYVVSKLDRFIDLVFFTDSGRSSLNLSAIKYALFFTAGMVAVGSAIVSNRIEWLSMAIQCDPGLYGPFDAKGVPLRNVSSEAICKKYDLPSPSSFVKIAPEISGQVTADTLPPPSASAPRSTK